jgi:hypothetical protein
MLKAGVTSLDHLRRDRNLCRAPTHRSRSGPAHTRRSKPHTIWHLVEVYLKIDGRLESVARRRARECLDGVIMKLVSVEVG